MQRQATHLIWRVRLRRKSPSSHAGIRGFAQKDILCYNLTDTIPLSGEDPWQAITRPMMRQ
jgi:hypothetical protein